MVFTMLFRNSQRKRISESMTIEYWCQNGKEERKLNACSVLQAMAFRKRNRSFDTSRQNRRG